jgi:hypothetical protein
MISQGNISGFYSYMYSQGYGYAALANGVVTCSGLAGNIAQNFMVGSAQAQGITLSAAQVTSIETDLANRYALTLIAAAQNNGGSTNTDVTFQQAWDFHTAAFTQAGLGEQTWTLDAPGQTLGSATMQTYWSNIISTNPATNALGVSEVIAAMDIAPGTNGGAQSWLNQVAGAAIQAVSGPNNGPACPVQSFIPLDLLADASGLGPNAEVSATLAPGANIPSLANALTELSIPLSSTQVASSSSDSTAVAEATANASARQQIYDTWLCTLQGLPSSTNGVSDVDVQITGASGNTINQEVVWNGANPSGSGMEVVQTNGVATITNLENGNQIQVSGAVDTSDLQPGQPVAVSTAVGTYHIDPSTGDITDSGAVTATINGQTVTLLGLGGTSPFALISNDNSVSTAGAVSSNGKDDAGATAGN